MRFRKKKHLEKEHYLAIFIILIGNMLGIFLSVVNEREVQIRYLPRNPYGEGAYEQSLNVYTGKEKEKIQIQVEEVMYGEKEIENYFQQTEQYLEKWYQEEIKEGEIHQSIDFPEKVPSNPVKLSWSTQDPEILDWEGKIGEEVKKKGEKTNIICTISLEEEFRIWERKVTVYPHLLNKQQKLEKRIQKQAEQISEKEGQKLLLPDMVDGKAVRYEKERNQQGILICVFSLVFGAGIPPLVKEKKKQREETIRKEMLADYPDIIEKLVLYLRAGFSIRKAMEKLASGYLRNKKQYHLKIRPAYEEVVKTCREMEGGMYESEAYERMGKRYGLANYKMLSVLLVQNLRKGNENLLELLEREAAAVTEERKRNARVKGEEASIKLLLPMVMQLIVVLIILMVPAFLNFM